jgi:hypothetical protein
MGSESAFKRVESLKLMITMLKTMVNDSTNGRRMGGVTVPLGPIGERIKTLP